MTKQQETKLLGNGFTARRTPARPDHYAVYNAIGGFCIYVRTLREARQFAESTLCRSVFG